MIRGSSIDPFDVLYDREGGRKYLCASERERFLKVAARQAPPIRALAELLAYTGCRISEGLALNRRRLDPETGRVVFLTLKRRRHTQRAVPVPREVMARLLALAQDREPEARLWPFCRQTAWAHIKRIMDAASIEGPQATPKGLRHAFGVLCAQRNLPPGLTRDFLGHASLETTLIYQHVRGDEERAFAERLW